MTHFSLKQITGILAALLFGLGGTIAAGLFYLSSETERVTANWVAFQAEYSQKARLKGALDTVLGYGGMIHAFKNLILRKDLEQLDRVVAHLGAGKLILEQYSALGLDNGEQAAVDDIYRTLEGYHQVLVLIESAILVSQSSQEIDAKVSVDDRYALRGLALLNQENILQHQSYVPGLSKALKLSVLRTRLGYGGLIHSFKNYLLRHEQSYATSARQAIHDSLAAINNYRKSGVSDSESIALDDIKAMIQAYGINLTVVEQMVKEGRSVEEVDAAVRIDDRLALRGLQILVGETKIQIQSHFVDMTLSLKQMRELEGNLLGVLLVLTITLLSLSIWLINTRIGRPFKKIINTMTSLSQGDTQVELIEASANTELGSMAKAIQIFRDEMIHREASDIALQNANKELGSRLTELVNARRSNDDQTNKALALAEGLAQARDESLLATKRAESEKERARAMINTVSDGIITIDSKCQILSFNPAAELIFGYSCSQVVGRNINLLMPECFRNKHDDYVDNYVRTGEGNIIGQRKLMADRREMIARRIDGCEISIEVSIGVSTIAGERMFTGVVRDISHQKKVAAMKHEFVSTVSHELRTPLTAIKGALGLLESGMMGVKFDGESEKLIQVTQRNVERLASLVDDILDIEKLESGDIKIYPLPMPVGDIVRDSVEVNKHYCVDNDISFEVDKTVNAALKVDGSRIAQVMANFLSNAVKFSFKGGVVSVGAQKKDGWVRVYVSDKGQGVPDEFKTRLFDRFTQADSSDVRRQGGTGLGMAISKAIVEKHGGRIGFDSVLDEGSTFYFELPEYQMEQSLDSPVGTKT